jgi:hypothetical protein
MTIFSLFGMKMARGDSIFPKSFHGPPKASEGPHNIAILQYGSWDRFCNIKTFSSSNLSHFSSIFLNNLSKYSNVQNIFLNFSGGDDMRTKLRFWRLGVLLAF